MLWCIILSVVIAGGFEGAMSEDTPTTPEHIIVGGTEADIRDHPYQLSLQVTDGHRCGASIIANRWALTAAHCIRFDVEDFRIRAGSSDKDLGTLYTVKNITKHPLYRRKDYDIALVEINGTFEFNDNVQPISLAENELPAGTMVNVTGWGSTSEGGPHSQHLMRITIPMIDRETCQSYYSGASVITERMVCAGNEEGGHDACQGDSGGPLATNGVLYGVVSWGRGCARPKSPTVYANVPNLRQWILETSGM